MAAPSPAAVAIVTPAFNSEATLEATVDSVLAQTSTDWTLQLFDNGSSDGSAAIAERLAQSDPRISFEAESVNIGPAPLRNRGAMRANTRYVQFLDADDLLHPRFLETMIEAMDRTGAEVGHCHVEYLDGSDVSRPPAPYTGPALCHPPEMVRYFHPFTPMFAGATLFQAAAFKRFDGFSEDPAWLSMQDQDLVLRMAAHCTFAYVDEVLLTVRVAPHTASRHPARRRAMREGLVAMTEQALERERVEQLGVEANLTAMLGRYRADLARWQAYEAGLSAVDSVRNLRAAGQAGEPWAKLLAQRAWETVRRRPHNQSHHRPDTTPRPGGPSR